MIGNDEGEGPHPKGRNVLAVQLRRLSILAAAIFVLLAIVFGTILQVQGLTGAAVFVSLLCLGGAVAVPVLAKTLGEWPGPEDEDSQ